MFSLFSVVQFKNDPCTSNDKISSASTNYRNGTCVTSSYVYYTLGSAHIFLMTIFFLSKVSDVICVNAPQLKCLKSNICNSTLIFRTGFHCHIFLHLLSHFRGFEPHPRRYSFLKSDLKWAFSYILIY